MKKDKDFHEKYGELIAAMLPILAFIFAIIYSIYLLEGK